MATKRVRTGTIQPWRDADGINRFRARIRLRDGSRPWVALPKGVTEKAARHLAKDLQKEEDAKGSILAAKKARAREKVRATMGSTNIETCDDWYERFKTYRRNEVGGVDDDDWRWQKWISKTTVRDGAISFGSLPVRDVTPDDIETVRDVLNAAVVAYEAAGNTKGDGRLAPKTARNVWAALTTPMKYACTRKGPRELRVREDLGNPCIGIPPPRDGSSKRRHWLRPSQWVPLASWLAENDIEWAEAITIGLYLHLRPGELHELRVRDIDLEAEEVRVERAYDERTKTVSTPKTESGIRTVTVPTALVPLLDRIVAAKRPNDRVCPIVAATPEKSRAGIFREFLRHAKVGSPAFFVETSTHLMIDFRSIRDSGITWRFLAGERAEVVQREAGHEHISTTLGYAKEVQDRRGRYGQPFPTLPQALLEPPTPCDVVHDVVYNDRKYMKLLSGRRDLNPRQQAPKACALPGCATPRKTNRTENI